MKEPSAAPHDPIDVVDIARGEGDQENSNRDAPFDLSDAADSPGRHADNNNGSETTPSKQSGMEIGKPKKNERLRVS